jgi:hypothetical protein
MERTAAIVGDCYLQLLPTATMEGVMNFSSARSFLMVGSTIAAVGAVLAPTAAFAAAVCPQFLTNYCVYDSHHRIFTMETNPCFAKERHWTVIYQGQCKFRH